MYSEISQYRNRLHQLRGKQQVLQEQFAKFTKDEVSLSKRLETIELSQALVQKVAQDTQEQLQIHIGDIVNSFLQTCFSDKYSFSVLFEQGRGSTEANFDLVKDGKRPNIKSSGGGLADIISTGLRFACWSLGNTQNILCLDESLKYLSADLQERAGEILKEVSEKLGLQILLVTHSPILLSSADKVFKITIKDGVTNVVEEEQ